MINKYKEGLWYGWNGGECPVHPKSMVQIVWQQRSGEITSSTAHAKSAAFTGAKGGDLIAFRVVKEYREPREWWVRPEYGLISATPRATGSWVRVREVLE